MSAFKVDTSDLQKAIKRVQDLPHAELSEALGEGITRFKARLRGSGQAPGDVWPIGTVKKSKSGEKYYVEPGKGRRSGRSLRGWKSRQKGISAVVFNDARDGVGGTYYARFIHRRNQAATEKDGLGAAAQEALEIFEEEMGKTAAEMSELMLREAG